MSTALLIIDVQNSVLEGSASSERQALVDQAQIAMVYRLRDVMARARDGRMAVVFVQHNEPPGSPLAANSEGWRIRAEVMPLAGEPVSQKFSCDAFHDTDLQSLLTAAGADHLIIAGNATQYCIDTTCRRAVSLGYDVTLLADCHMTGDSGALTFDQIVAHHNATLNGFSAGRHEIKVIASPLWQP